MNFFKYLLIIVFSLETGLCATSVNLSGVVLDEFNRPISAADVSLYRSGLKTRTDANGEFILSGNSCNVIRKKSQTISSVRINGKKLFLISTPVLKTEIVLYDLRGRQISKKSTVNSGVKDIDISARLLSGIYFITITNPENLIAFRFIVSGNAFGIQKEVSKNIPLKSVTTSSSTAVKDSFSDILIASSMGTQTVRRLVKSSVEKGITLQLMPIGAANITPGIPVFTDKGGIGDVTTYGSVTNPEYSEGGACNYGSTGIKYYAAINVNQIPGDLKGQWQGGQICGRCARVRVTTKDGEERTTVVRIVDKCADDNCGIDLGGAPAGQIMGTQPQPGRYYGEWEWVSCEGVNGVSDNPPSLYVKTGSNEWWSLVQVRNGTGSVEKIRMRKSGTAEWLNLTWATEAENYFKVPEEILQDSNIWEIEVVWDFGKSGSLQIQGKMLSIEDTSYTLVL